MPSSEINFTTGTVMQPGGSSLTPPAGYDVCQEVTNTPYPDPNDPVETLRDLLIAARNTGGVDARTTTTETISTASRGKIVTLSNSGAIAVTLSSTVDSKFICWADVIGAGSATLTPSSGTINGGSSLAVAAGNGAVLFFDGTNWRAIVVAAITGPGSGVIESIGITVDGGGSALTTGSKGFFQVQFSGTIKGVTLLADQSGSVQFDIRKSTYSGFPTNSSIVASDPPVLSSAQKSNDTTLTGWTTSFTDGDVFEYKVSSATTVTRVTLILRVQRS